MVGVVWYVGDDLCGVCCVYVGGWFVCCCYVFGWIVGSGVWWGNCVVVVGEWLYVCVGVVWSCVVYWVV